MTNPERPALHWPTNVTPATPPADLADAAAEQGVEFEEGDLARLSAYVALLLAANELTNLTAAKDAETLWRRHILDALTLVPVLAELPDNARVLDVGTGAGLPGIPLAITQPHLRFTLLDATGKKIEFLRHVVSELALENVQPVHDRAERLAHDRGQRVSQGGLTTRVNPHRESYDLVLARAVGPMPVIAELTVPFATKGGLVALVKGEKAEAELEEAAKAIEMLGAAHAGTIDTPTGRIVVLEKLRATPRLYPRADGEPKRRPLGVER